MSLFDEVMKRVRGPRDIKLPNESGNVDPRLPRTIGNTIEKFSGFKKKLDKNLSQFPKK
jgi:hypothetical protein